MLKATRTRGVDLIEIRTKAITLAQLWAEEKETIRPGDVITVKDGDRLLAQMYWNWQQKVPTIKFM